MFKHWKRYLAIAGLSVSFAVAPVAFAQEATPEPTPIGGEAPSEIPTPGDVTNSLLETIINSVVAILGGAASLELIIAVLRYLPFLAVFSDDVLKGVVAGVIVIIYVGAGVFGFTGQFNDVVGLLKQFLPLLLGILSLFAVAPKVRAYAVRNEVPVFQQAGRG